MPLATILAIPVRKRLWLTLVCFGSAGGNSNGSTSQVFSPSCPLLRFRIAINLRFVLHFFETPHQSFWRAPQLPEAMAILLLARIPPCCDSRDHNSCARQASSRAASPIPLLSPATSHSHAMRFSIPLLAALFASVAAATSVREAADQLLFNTGNPDDVCPDAKVRCFKDNDLTQPVGSVSCVRLLLPSCCSTATPRPTRQLTRLSVCADLAAWQKVILPR